MDICALPHCNAAKFPFVRNRPDTLWSLQMFKRDEIETAKGPLAITPIHHASLVLEWNGEVIYCDPVGGAQRYDGLARPSAIILTHHHGDHYDLPTLQALIGKETTLVAPRVVLDQLPDDIAAKTGLMANGDETQVRSFGLKAVPMYNTTPERAKFHEKGVGNGYVFDFAGTTLYLASDTEPVEEMNGLAPVDIAFFPMNLPYTMTPAQVVEAAQMVKPKVVYPFHYAGQNGQNRTEPEELVALLPPTSGIEVRIRDWYPAL